MTTPSASQLWSSTSNYRREGGPEYPDEMEWDEELKDFTLWGGVPSEGIDSTIALQVDKTAAILGWHGLEFIARNSEAYSEAVDEIGYWTLSVCVKRADGVSTWARFRSTSRIENINSAIGAVLDAREGK